MWNTSFVLFVLISSDVYPINCQVKAQTHSQKNIYSKFQWTFHSYEYWWFEISLMQQNFVLFTDCYRKFWEKTFWHQIWKGILIAFCVLYRPMLFFIVDVDQVVGSRKKVVKTWVVILKGWAKINPSLNRQIYQLPFVLVLSVGKDFDVKCNSTNKEN